MRRTVQDLAEARGLLEESTEMLLRYRPSTIPCHKGINGEWVPDAEHPIDGMVRKVAAFLAANPAPACAAEDGKSCMNCKLNFGCLLFWNMNGPDGDRCENWEPE